MTKTVTISFPITTCAICGERDWKHVRVLGATGSYCRPCSFTAIREVSKLQAHHRAKCWASMVFSLTPLWKPPAREAPHDAAHIEIEERGE